MLTVKTIKNKIKEWIGIKKREDGILLRFKNESNSPILSLRVVIRDEVHEFRGINENECTEPIALNKSNLYFFSYIITPSEKLYFEPNPRQLDFCVNSGEVIVSIFILSNKNQNSYVLMCPKVIRFGSMAQM